MHRFLANTPKGMDTDHINRNKLDNRRCNLRVVNRSENMFNTPKSSKNKSGYKGVHIVPVSVNPKNRWVAQITKNYKNFFLGYYPTAKTASDAYNKKLLEFCSVS